MIRRYFLQPFVQYLCSCVRRRGGDGRKRDNGVEAPLSGHQLLHVWGAGCSLAGGQDPSFDQHLRYNKALHRRATFFSLFLCFCLSDVCVYAHLMVEMVPYSANSTMIVIKIRLFLYV